jgi:2',3'-cyclic-nucleotide 2'-phosphodiesterase (5'-nucleotidase family)
MVARNLLLGALLALSHSQNVYAAQPGSASPLPAKLRDITWGKLNFLHTTDTHGWLAGHLQE